MPARSFVMLMALSLATGCLGTSTEVSISTTEGTTTTSGDADAALSPTTAPEEELPPLEELDVPAADPSASNLVTLGAGVKPGGVEPGGIVTLAIRVRIADSWHIYAVDKPTGVSKPTELELNLPDGVTAAGDWDVPKPKEYEKGVFVYEKDVVFRRRVKVADNATGMLDLKCKVKYQPCDKTSCRMPTSGTTSIGLEIKDP